MVKYKVTQDQKVTLYALLIAFFLSCLIGIISGNPIGIVIMRAMISGILFGALVYGGIYILKRYIPEVEQVTAREKTLKEFSADSQSGGTVVDYTVPHKKLQKEPGELFSDEKAGETPLEDSVQSPQEEREGNGQFQKAHEGGIETAQERIPVEGQQERGGRLSPKPETASDSELPSLDRLFDEHDKEIVPESEPARRSSSGGPDVVGDYLKVGDAQFPNEPETLAKAVKRVMKQDE
jgi:hypothetical protein